jgi:hypothetical protein
MDLSQNQDSAPNSLLLPTPMNTLSQDHQTIENPLKTNDISFDNINSSPPAKPLLNHEDKSSFRDKSPPKNEQKIPSSSLIDDVNTVQTDDKNDTPRPSQPFPHLHVDNANFIPDESRSDDNHSLEANQKENELNESLSDKESRPNNVRFIRTITDSPATIYGRPVSEFDPATSTRARLHASNHHSARGDVPPTSGVRNIDSPTSSESTPDRAEPTPDAVTDTRPNAPPNAVNNAPATDAPANSNATTKTNATASHSPAERPSPKSKSASKHERDQRPESPPPPAETKADGGCRREADCGHETASSDSSQPTAEAQNVSVQNAAFISHSSDSTPQYTESPMNKNAVSPTSSSQRTGKQSLHLQSAHVQRTFKELTVLSTKFQNKVSEYIEYLNEIDKHEDSATNSGTDSGRRLLSLKQRQEELESMEELIKVLNFAKDFLIARCKTVQERKLKLEERYKQHHQQQLDAEEEERRREEMEKDELIRRRKRKSAQHRAQTSGASKGSKSKHQTQSSGGSKGSKENKTTRHRSQMSGGSRENKTKENRESKEKEKGRAVRTTTGKDPQQTAAKSPMTQKAVSSAIASTRTSRTYIHTAASIPPPLTTATTSPFHKTDNDLPRNSRRSAPIKSSQLDVNTTDSQRADVKQREELGGDKQRVESETKVISQETTHLTHNEERPQSQLNPQQQSLSRSPSPPPPPPPPPPSPPPQMSHPSSSSPLQPQSTLPVQLEGPKDNSPRSQLSSANSPTIALRKGTPSTVTKPSSPSLNKVRRLPHANVLSTTRGTSATRMRIPSRQNTPNSSIATSTTTTTSPIISATILGAQSAAVTAEPANSTNTAANTTTNLLSDNNNHINNNFALNSTTKSNSPRKTAVTSPPSLPNSYDNDSKILK